MAALWAKGPENLSKNLTMPGEFRANSVEDTPG